MKAMCVIFCIVCVALFQVSYGQVSWDSACGVTKGCFPDCTGGCEYLVTWTPGASDVAFEVMVAESAANVYAAIAFSEDLRMGDDSVVSCLVPGTSVESGWNDDTHYESLSSLGLSSTSVAQSGGVITCTFTRTYSESSSKYFNINDDYILMLVIGDVESENGANSVGHHDKIPWNSDGKVDFNSVNIYSLYKLNSPLIKLHGIMMMLAWMLLSLVGMMTARYNKELMGDKKLLGAKIWFQLHRGCMVLVVVFTVIGFIPVFVELSGYSQILSPALTKAHPILGIIVTVLVFANPIMGILRPGPDHSKRWLFNWAHLGVGYISQILAVIVVLLGYLMERADLSIGIVIVTVVHIVVVIAYVIALEVFNFKRKQTKVDKAAEVKQSSADGTTTFEMDEKPAAKQPCKFPMYMLFAFSLVSFGFAIASLAIMAAS